MELCNFAHIWSWGELGLLPLDLKFSEMVNTVPCLGNPPLRNIREITPGFTSTQWEESDLVLKTGL